MNKRKDQQNREYRRSRLRDGVDGPLGNVDRLCGQVKLSSGNTVGAATWIRFLNGQVEEGTGNEE